jgi:ABC-2 type transport system permease protein
MLNKIYAYLEKNVRMIRSAPGEIFQITVWPLIGLLSIGLLGNFAVGAGAASETMGYIILGVLIWNFFSVAARSMFVGFMYDVWDECLKHHFTDPVRTRDFLLGNGIFALIASIIGFILVGTLSIYLFSFNVFSIGFYLIPGLFIVLLHGLADGLIINSLILRKGYGYHSLGWAIPGFVMIFSGVYYPISTLPEIMQKIAFFLPSSHAIEGLRGIIGLSNAGVSEFYIGIPLAIIYFSISAWIFKQSIIKAKHNGFITKY